jgi:hypothetical protein
MFVTTRYTRTNQSIPAGCDAQTRYQPACAEWEARAGLGHTVALYDRPSTSYHIR